MQHADAEAKHSKGAAQNSLLSAVALCDHAGEVIYVGQTRGTIAIVDANSLRFLDVIKARPPILFPQISLSPTFCTGSPLMAASCLPKQRQKCSLVFNILHAESYWHCPYYPACHSLPLPSHYESCPHAAGMHPRQAWAPHEIFVRLAHFGLTYPALAVNALLVALCHNLQRPCLSSVYPALLVISRRWPPARNTRIGARQFA